MVRQHRRSRSEAEAEFALRKEAEFALRKEAEQERNHMDFDVNSINSMYSQYLQDSASAAKKTADLNKDYTKATDDELMDVCKEFEAYFLEQCFKEMMKTVGNEDETMSSSSNVLLDYYKDNFVKEMAADSTEKQSLGLAQTLYEQMKRNYDL